jgi:hypothetical protein
MQAFLINLAMKIFKIHIDTTKTKSFFVGLGWIASGLAAAATLGTANDGNVVHYIACLVPVLKGIGTITNRDAITKLSDKLEGMNLGK